MGDGAVIDVAKAIRIPTEEPLPHAVLLWMHDGRRVTTEWRVVGQ